MSRQTNALEVETEEFIDELKPGTELMRGQYTIEDFLAAGGFGITYLARDSLNRRVVIKECFPGSFCRRQNASVLPRSRAHQAELRSIVQLFSQEAMSLAKTKHPNIVGVHQVFEENNTAYMALDYVEGRDLLEILENDPGSLTPDLVEKYLARTLEAVKHIHELGILHRDIAPDNIIINTAGEPIMIDFGAARETTNEKVTRMLSALRAVKDGYSPQEFYIAGSEQSPSCDLYSLAASFYHVITCELPPDAQWRLSAVAAGDPDPYVPLSDKNTGYSPVFVASLDKALAILPRDRMQNADEWMSALKKAAPVAAVEPFPLNTRTAVPETKKSSMMPFILGTTGLVAAAGVGLMVMSGSETEAPPERAASVATPAPVPEPAPVAEPAPEIAESAAPETNETPVLAAAPSADPQPILPLTEPVIDPVTSDAAPLPEPERFVNLAAANLDLVAPEQPSGAALAQITSLPMAVTLPDTFSAPAARPLRLAEVALIDALDAQPEIDLTVPTPPVRQEPTVVAEATAPAPVAAPAVDQTASQSGVDFFVSMAKSQPALSSVQTGSLRTTVTPDATSSVASEPSQPSSIITSSMPAIPFSLSPFQPGLITSVSTDSPTWLTANTRILSIDGHPVSTNDQIAANLAALASGAAATQFDVTLGLESGLTGAAFERTLTVTKETRTLLLNGLSFVSRQTRDGWKTFVTDAPAGSSFRVGDVLVSYAATWEDLNGPDTLTAILERDLEAGLSTFSFAVDRGGEIWIEAFNLTSLAD